MIINMTGGGTTPTGSITITANGTYDVTDKASAVVNVAGGTDGRYYPYDPTTLILPSITMTYEGDEI